MGKKALTKEIEKESSDDPLEEEIEEEVTDDPVEEHLTTNNMEDLEEVEYHVEEEDFPEIINLPYTRKRIQQNLKNINFEEDSDEDWNMTDKTNEDIAVHNSNMVKILRKRCNYVRYDNPDISSDEEDVEASRSNRLRSHENSDISSDEEDRSPQNKVLITPPPNFEISPIINKHIEHYKKVVARSKALAPRSWKTVQENVDKRVQCNNCKKFFVRISAHKNCKGMKKH